MSDQHQTYAPFEPPAAEPPRHRRKWPLVVAVVAVVALILGGGAVIAVSRHNAAVAKAHREAIAAKKATEKREFEAARKARLKREAEEKRAAQADYDACRSEIDPFLNDMKTVHARLNVGITESVFSELVGAASVSHDALDVDKLQAHTQGECVQAGITLEKALNKYISAASVWNDCLYEDDSCDMDQIDPQLQLKWASATGLIEKAEAKLDAADPANPDADSTTGSDQT